MHLLKWCVPKAAARDGCEGLLTGSLPQCLLRVCSFSGFSFSVRNVAASRKYIHFVALSEAFVANVPLNVPKEGIGHVDVTEMQLRSS